MQLELRPSYTTADAHKLSVLYVFGQESSGWELRAGFLGTVRVRVPLTALYTEPCSIEVHEALFTVRPRPPGAARRQTADAPDGVSET